MCEGESTTFLPFCYSLSLLLFQNGRGSPGIFTLPDAVPSTAMFICVFAPLIFLFLPCISSICEYMNVERCLFCFIHPCCPIPMILQFLLYLCNDRRHENWGATAFPSLSRKEVFTLTLLINFVPNFWSSIFPYSNGGKWIITKIEICAVLLPSCIQMHGVVWMTLTLFLFSLLISTFGSSLQLPGKCMIELNKK